MQMKRIYWLLLCGFGLVLACTSTHHKATSTTDDSRSPAGVANQELRGNLGEYDPGAPAGSEWIKLFADVPNYRRVGSAILGGTDEKFRWEMGPMWYRGRLGENQVKVLVVGQEGAQDENISNRAFTGSTGTKTQYFLNHIGIFRSYIFLNTFVYTINGQLEDSPTFDYLEQGSGVDYPEMSPIVKYRHRLFDHMLVTNAGKIALFIGVGSGGKTSLATWINARGGRCNVAYDLKDCDTSDMVKKFREGFDAPYEVNGKKGTIIKADLPANAKILAIGVPHPGGASQANGGASALDNIKRGFTNAAIRVAAAKSEDPNWLPSDVDDPHYLNVNKRIAEMNEPFKYQDAVIPYRDFDFGTNKRMGFDGTTSNRNGANSIQVFSKFGVYSERAEYSPQDEQMMKKYSYEDSNIEKAGFVKGKDLPWEPPKIGSGLVSVYDPGPCGSYDNYDLYSKNYTIPPCEVAEMMMSGWPETKEAQSASFGATSIYRGRLNKADLLVIADQTSHDDFFSGRALSGEMGQKLQTWIDKQGVGSNYAIIRTSPWDTLMPNGKNNEALLARARPHLIKILEIVVNQSKTKRIVGMGSYAQKIAKEFASKNKIRYEDIDVSTERLTAIPRLDLPFHSRWWMGTSGNRAIRAITGEFKPGNQDGRYHYYRVFAPSWQKDKGFLPALESKVKSEIQGGLAKLQ